MIEKVTAHNPEQIKRFEEIRGEALEILSEFENETFFIDKGGAGLVYELPGNLCMKILIERHNLENSADYDLGNTVEDETLLQERMARTNYTGKTRVPKTVSFLSGTFPIERSAIIMERLNAINLQHAINGTEELPENFDVDDFFDELSNFVQHMHEVEKIAHMDLYARNVMVDRDTGMPYVIDFGRSEKLKDPEASATKENEDWDRLDEIYKELEKLKSLQAK